MFWFGIFTLVIWMSAKSFGTTFYWILAFLYFIAIVIVWTVGIRIGRTLKKVDRLERTVSEIGKDLREIQRQA